MTDNYKVNIYEILDMFNEEVGYIGLDNEGKTTDERDDVITRQTFNNWLREYNQTHTRKIRSKKIDQYNNEWYRLDIEKLIKTPRVQKRLKDAYLRKTEPLFDGFEHSSKRVSKLYKERLRERHQEGFEIAIKDRIEKLIDEIIREDFILKFRNQPINPLDYIDRNKVVDEFIDMEKVIEEAFKIEDNFYGITEYDQTGNIIAVHHKAERPATSYFIKDRN